MTGLKKQKPSNQQSIPKLPAKLPTTISNIVSAITTIPTTLKTQLLFFFFRECNVEMKSV
jgi:hypothetical protein